MSVADDIVNGVLCMGCQAYLISEKGELCSCGHPVYCYSCWKNLPRRERENGVPFFDEDSGEILTDED